MGRLNVASGVFEAWNVEDVRGFSIIDTMMNLSLLFWAADERNEPRFRNAAIIHLERAICEFVRDDNSVHHIIEFDQKTLSASFPRQKSQCGVSEDLFSPTFPRLRFPA